ncbi:MAG: metalloprotease TldD, partial [Proteobacteria bacterium]|nr:metalloprotease TldD [Pseudomonadota bacterium]
MSSDADSPATDTLTFFRERFGLDESNLSAGLGTALERSVDFADLFFEYSTQDSVVLEESIVKSGDRHIEQGVGVRVQRGERQGYAHSDEISVESVRLAASTARAISEQSSGGGSVTVSGGGAPGRDLYPVATAPTDVPVEQKVSLLGEMDSYARSLDSRIVQVMASVIGQQRHLLMVGSDGTLVGDVQPLVRLNVQVIAADGERREIG